jgi:hypothetical protein
MLQVRRLPSDALAIVRRTQDATRNSWSTEKELLKGPRSTSGSPTRRARRSHRGPAPIRNGRCAAPWTEITDRWASWGAGGPAASERIPCPSATRRAGCARRRGLADRRCVRGPRARTAGRGPRVRCGATEARAERSTIVRNRVSAVKTITMRCSRRTQFSSWTYARSSSWQRFIQPANTSSKNCSGPICTRVRSRVRSPA